jgi:predicted kinase
VNVTAKKLRAWWKRTRHESDLYASGASNAMYQGLLRLAKQGKIERGARGKYMAKGTKR